ncbi:nucleoporin Nup120/160-domain-containing protein [Coprinopsis sp. MPI-PUGE-AT-0042]|nr:nucleoporin Nup120/160-domain-containing protein [Coprinopsis sp. MPI-PUGE-AT-0042]
MEEFIVASHVSSVANYPPSTVTIQTVRQHLPLPRTPVNSIPTDHAIFASTIDHEATGTIGLRLIHGGLIIELVSLSHSVAPLRLIFPSLVMESPAVFLWEDIELHVLAVTESGSLYRIVVPVQGSYLWERDLERVWPREYLIRHMPEDTEGCMVHVQGPHCMAISTKNGSLLRLESESLGYESQDEEWTENLSHQATFLSTFASFIPTRQASQPNAADIISISTHPWPSDIGHVWTLSRDRTLRLWKAKLGCVASKTLPHAAHSVEHSRAPSVSGGHPGRSHPLLDEARQNLVKVFSTEAHVFALVFIPSQASVTSAGFFCLLDTTSDNFRELGIIECSRRTVHCHLQDFVVQIDSEDGEDATLVTLWESQGRAMVEKTSLNIQSLRDNEQQINLWSTAAYPQEHELTPAYMEEKLLAPGSLAEKFLENIFKPGVFSSLSLRTAIDQYTDACLSLPGPPPPQLMAAYQTLCENVAAVVGCTVVLNRDSNGAFQYTNYSTALKRDWEGFVARCREVERSARWPLSLSILQNNQIVLMERERAASLASEDMPIQLHRLITQDHQIHDDAYDILAAAGALRQKIGPQAMAVVESHVLDLLQQEVSWSLLDILMDHAQKIDVAEYMDEGTTSWFQGRVQAIDINRATKAAIDTIGELSFSAKHEEDEVNLLALSSSAHSEWLRSLAGAYVSTAVEARYQLTLSLITMLLFLPDMLPRCHVALLGEVLAIFRGTFMLRFVCNQPAERPSTLKEYESGSLEDDVLRSLQNMDVTHNRVPTSAPISLLNILLAQTASGENLPVVAHKFLDSTGLLESVSPAISTKFEVLFCERLRLLKFYAGALELLTSLPKTAGVAFVLSQTWLQVGRWDEAAQLFERLAGSFGPDSALTLDESEALTLVLPAAQAIASDFEYYAHVSELFRRHSLTRYEVHFAELSISAAPPSSDTAHLWLTVARGYANLALYEEAYAALMAMPYEKQKRDFASQLALQMCEGDAVARLMAFDFAGISDEVESILSFKARNVDPRIGPNYSRILYTWYIQRGEYRNASLTMYQRALKLQEIITSVTLFLDHGEEQLDSYSIAINALSLVEENGQWITLPIVKDSSKKRKTLSRYIPESRFQTSKHDACIVHLTDIRQSYTLLSAQIDIIKREPDILASPEFLLPPPVIVMRLAHHNLLNQALSVASGLGVDMTDLFIQLASQCVRLSKASTNYVPPIESDWLLTDNASTWSGSPADRGWKFLRQALNRYDNATTDYRYTKAVMETVLSVDRNTPPPPWLVQTLEAQHPEHLIRLALRYEKIEDAVSYSLSILHKSDAQLARQTGRQASTTWLPYALIDQVIVAASSETKPPARLAQLRTEIGNRLKRLQQLGGQKSA